MANDIEEVFWKLKLEVLVDLRELLVKDLQSHKYFDYLRSKRVLDKDDCDEILTEKSRRRQAGVFMDILSSKGPEAFDEFCEALRREKTQIHLLQKLLSGFEEKRNVFLEFSPGALCSDDLSTIEKPVPNIVSLDIKSFPHPGDAGAPTIPQDSPKEPSTNKDNSKEKPGEGQLPPNEPPPPYTE